MTLPLYPSTSTLILAVTVVHAVGADPVRSVEFVSGEAAETWLEGAGYEHVTGPVWRKVS